MPAYAGLISSMGLAFLMETTYLLPLTIVVLMVAVGSLALRARRRRRRGYGPLVLGIVAAMLLLIGKFVFESIPAMYASAGLLFAASVWNSWPRRTAKNVTGASTETLYQIGSYESEIQP